jgi:hypothetical protein
LSAVLRYGVGQRQRISSVRSHLERTEENSGLGSSVNDHRQDEDMEVDGINAMVAGVKTRGVRSPLSLRCCIVTDNF